MKKTLAFLAALAVIPTGMALAEDDSPIRQDDRQPGEAMASGAEADRFTLQVTDPDRDEDHDDDRDDDDDHDDDDDDDEGRAPAGGPAPAGTVAPPQNGLFGTGAPPQVRVN